MIYIENRIKLLDYLKLKGKVCVEVGVLWGDFSLEIYKHNPEILYLVDLWKHQNEKEYVDHHNHTDEEFENMYQTILITYHSCNNVCVVRKHSREAAVSFLGKVDFVYLDANTAEKERLADMMLWYPKINPGGWLVVHDYPRGSDRVENAVKQFCKISGCEVKLFTNEPTWASCGIQVQ